MTPDRELDQELQRLAGMVRPPASIVAQVMNALEAEPVSADGPPSARLVPDVPTDGDKAVSPQLSALSQSKASERDAAARATVANSQPPRRRHVRRRLMDMFQSRVVRWAIPMAVAAAIILGVGLWPGKNRYDGIVLADVLRQLSSAPTITCNAVWYRDGRLEGTMSYMSKNGHLLRISTSDGHIYVQDTSKHGTLVLNTRTQTATTLDSIPTELDLYKTLKNFRNGTERVIGTKVIEGREAVGFACQFLHSQGTVWVDLNTRAPIQVCEDIIDAEGRKVQIVTSNFVFDVPLDDALFSMEVPEGYVRGDVESKSVSRAQQLVLNVRSASAGNRILKACIRFAEDHDGDWPADLQSLSSYGIDASALLNPRRPDLAVGWTYVRPSAKLNSINRPESTILLHETFGAWNEGINVGFADGRVEFMKDQKRFEHLLALGKRNNGQQP